MKSLAGKAFARLLEIRGGHLARINGSHHIYMKSGLTTRISVPIHGNNDFKLGLLRHFMKIVGIKEPICNAQRPKSSAETTEPTALT